MFRRLTRSQRVGERGVVFRRCLFPQAIFSSQSRVFFWRGGPVIVRARGGETVTLRAKKKKERGGGFG